MTPSSSNNFQTPIEVSFDIEPQTNVTRGNVVENSKVGELRGDLWMAKDGKIVVNDNDYRFFDASSFSYASSTTLSVSGLDATKYFQEGDKLTLNQSGSTKYFYVNLVASNLLTVNGGDDYSVANSNVEKIGVSRLANPSGFPGYFNYTPGVSSSPGSVSLSSGSLNYTMSGKEVSLFGSLSISIDSGSPVEVRVDFPFAIKNPSTSYGKPTVKVVSSGTDAFAYLGYVSYGAALSTTYFGVYRPNTTAFTGSGLTVDPFFSYLY